MADSYSPVDGLPPDFVAGVAAPSASPPADLQGAETVYKGQVLPLSLDAAGKAHLDWSAGVPGVLGQGIAALANAFTAPADAFEGKISPSYGDQNTIDRALNFAAAATPMNPAAASGEAGFGALTKTSAPTAAQLKAAASQGYDAARASGLEIKGDAVGDMARGLQTTLQSDQGIIAKTAPKTFAILDELASPPAGGVATIAGIDAARRGLSGISAEGGTDGLAAGTAVRRLDDFVSAIPDGAVAASNPGSASPQAIAQTLRDARGNYAAAQRSNDLTGDLDRANTGIVDRAEARAEASHSGRNLDNAIRQRVASFLQNPENVAGFSQPEIDALNGVVAGGPLRNTSRFVGNIFGGGGGMHSGLMGAIGAGAGALEHGTAGAMVGAAALPTIGYAAKSLQNAFAKRALNNADQIVRTNSPLARALAAEGALTQPSIGRNSAVMRAILPGLMAPQPPTLAEALSGGA